MARAYLRNRMGRESAPPQNPVLGFLDINFGVLGIFLIVFTIRLVVVSQPAGSTADLVLVIMDAGSSKTASFDLYRKDSPDPTRLSGDKDEIQAHLATAIETITTAGQPVAKLLLLLPAEGYRAEILVSNALSRIERSHGAGYLPFISTLRPVLDEAHIARLIAAWREGAL